MDVHTVLEEELRERGDGLLPHEMGEQAIEEFVDGVISVFEKMVISEVAKTAVDVDYGYIAQQVRKVLQDYKQAMIREMSLVLTVMALTMVDGSPIFLVFRKALTDLMRMIVEKYEPSNLTSEALGLAIGDILEEAEEESERKPEPKKATKNKNITVFSPIGGNA